MSEQKETFSKIYNKSYSNEENRRVEERLNNCSVLELAETIHALVYDFFNDTPVIVQRYEDLICRLSSKEVLIDKIKYLKKFLKYKASLAHYRNIEKVRPILLAEFNCIDKCGCKKYNTVEKFLEDSNYNKILKEHLPEIGFLSEEEAKKALRPLGSKTGYHKPLPPKKNFKTSYTDIETLSTLKKDILLCLAEYMIYYLDAPNVDNLNVTLLFMAARLSSTDSSHHTASDRPFVTGKKGYDTYFKEYSSLLEELKTYN